MVNPEDLPTVEVTKTDKAEEKPTASIPEEDTATK